MNMNNYYGRGNFQGPPPGMHFMPYPNVRVPPPPLHWPQPQYPYRPPPMIPAANQLPYPSEYMLNHPPPRLPPQGYFYPQHPQYPHRQLPPRYIQQLQQQLNSAYPNANGNGQQRPTSANENAPNVLLYIDNSNIFESAKKHSGQKKGYMNGIPDVACRIDIGKLISRAVGGRGLLFGKLYGSEPPALDTVWEAIRRKAVHVETFQRSKWTLKEKETDASLVADAVEDILTEKDTAGSNRTVILFSGDRDLMRVISKAVKHDYRVEIWSFKSSINNLMKREAQEKPDQVVVNAIDDIFNEITYTKVIWGKTKIPPERSLVATLNIPANVNKRQMLNTFVAKVGEIFHLPMMGKYTDKYRYIILVPCIKEYYTPPTQGRSPHEQQPIRTYDFYRHIQPFIHQLHEHFSNICEDIKTWMEFIASRHSINKFELPLSNKFSGLKVEDEDRASNQSEEESIGNNLSDDDSEDFDCIDFFDKHAEDEDPCDLVECDDGFIPNVRKEVKQKRLYSEFCSFKFACSKGLNCTYKHTEKEKEFFKLHSDHKRRYLYKTKPCYHTVCNYSAKPYLCPYAHTMEESRCLACKQKGNGQHWMHECPVIQTHGVNTSNNL